MKFGTIALDAAEGAVLAHSIRHDAGVFKKGRRLTAEDVAQLRAAGIEQVIAARLEETDIGEDPASATIAEALAGANVSIAEPFTGRANLFSTVHGLAVIDEERVNALNLLDESLTVASVGAYQAVSARQMLATVKVIPFAVSKSVLEEARALCAQGPLLAVAPFVPRRAGLVMTELPQTKEAILEKSVRAMTLRLEEHGSTLEQVVRCAHDEDAVAGAIESLRKAGCSPILLFGASAIVDRGDVLPRGLVLAGGDVVHLGMPVDPGNLMMLGRHGETPVIGVPSCARSPKVNGFDWVLQRVLAGVEITSRDIMLMGVGGLLKEIPSRPAPRGQERGQGPSAPVIAAVVLAAGQSRRMGATNKLLAEIDGKPMVRRVVETVGQSQAGPVVVVTGHESARVRQALEGLQVTFVENPDYADGLSTSLAAGVAALPGEVDGAVVCLGDMPLVEPRHINKLISAFDPEEGRTICVPVSRGKRGNPVLWGADYFAEMKKVKGDVGAKHLLGQHAEAVCEVELDDAAVLTDIDTPDALEKVTGTDRT